jgi:hypothetical protein
MKTFRHAFRLPALLVLLSLAAGVRADDPVSGPEAGKPAPGFEMEIATGEQAGKKLDYLSTLKDKPVLVIFVGEMTRPGFGLLRILDKYGRLRQPDGLEVIIARLSENPEETIRHAKLLEERYEIKSVAGVPVGGKLGPAEYGLHDEAAMTVLLLDKEHKVLFNLARRAPDRVDFEEIRKQIDKLLGPSAVPFNPRGL